MQQDFMQQALHEAEKAAQAGEVPIGAVIVCDNQIIARAHNTCEGKHNPLAHAELTAIEKAAGRKQNWRLNDCDLYVTLEPCPMCLGALFQARIRNLYFGCFDPKRKDSPFFPTLRGHKKLSDNNHTLHIHGGILEKECSVLLKDFFKTKRT